MPLPQAEHDSVVAGMGRLLRSQDLSPLRIGREHLGGAAADQRQVAEPFFEGRAPVDRDVILDLLPRISVISGDEPAARFKRERQSQHVSHGGVPSLLLKIN